MRDEPVSGAESLEIIQNMINKAKNQFSENGFMYLLWGWAIFTLSISQFVLKHFFQEPRHYLVWTLVWIVLIIQFIYIWKKRRAIRVKTYTEEILKYVWICFVIVMFLLSFVLSKALGYEYDKLMNPILLVAYGIPTFLSGFILRFQPLVIGGIGCWALSIIATFLPYDFRILTLSLAVVIAWIIPGYLLRAKYKRENTVS